MEWGFYGRREELKQLSRILHRGRWFFCKITGRRRIGKTTLIQEALKTASREKVLYVQIPDSGPAGVISAVVDQMSMFGVPEDRFPPPRTLQEVAGLVSALATDGYVVALDEFQYFNRKHIRPFCSLLQSEVDGLASRAASVPGGLVVLGFLHTEMAAILEDRDMPLYHRVTDSIELPHLDVESILEILRAHATTDPGRLLFLWTLFEGVPKFYRDCFEQGVLASDRRDLLRVMFFDSSSPLRSEADNWFLREFKGRYDVVLKYIARHSGCPHADIVNHAKSLSRDEKEQVAGYLKILRERFHVITKKLPVFAKPRTPKGRYYVADNFLRAWLVALAGPVSAINFQPIDKLVEVADERLRTVEGHALEDLVATIYEERSRKGLPGFALSRRIEGYWNSKDTEIDLVAIDDASEIIRFGFCKRSAGSIPGALSTDEGHIARFLEAFAKYRTWNQQRVQLAPVIGPDVRRRTDARGWLTEDLADLTAAFKAEESPGVLF